MRFVASRRLSFAATRRVAVGLLAAALLGLPAGAAVAQEVRLTPEVLTDVPLGIGAGLDGEVSQVRFGLSALWVPPAYVALADEVAQGIGGYDDLTSALVRAATENALALRLRVGARPFSSSQFYIDANYTLVALGGSLTNEDLVAASGQSAQSGPAVGWDLQSTLHQVGVELGYRFLVDPVSIRVGLGGSFTVSAAVDATQTVDARNPRVARGVEEVGEAYLEDTYLSYVHLAVLTVAVGWDFHL